MACIALVCHTQSTVQVRTGRIKAHKHYNVVYSPDSYKEAQTQHMPHGAMLFFENLGGGGGGLKRTLYSCTGYQFH